MLQRLIAWCVPDSALELRAGETAQAKEATLGQALAPYESAATAAEAPAGG